MKKWIAGLVVVVVLGGGLWAYLTAARSDAPQRTPIVVTRGTIVKTAVATGRIEPKHMVHVRSQFGGLVGERFVKLGDRVERGDPLVDIRQEVTRISLINARRSIDAARMNEQAAQEYVQGEHLAARFMRFVMGRKELERMGMRAAMGRQEAIEAAKFLETGKLRIGDEEVDTIVRAPAGGHVIDLISTPGQRVVPVGSYQAPTEVATLADMDDLEFRGRVDEIDVGLLSAGMPAEVSVGALPGVRLQGELREVGLRARSQDNATLFDVWVEIGSAEGQTIRAGYSATCEIFIQRREQVVVIPERVIEFKDGKPLVDVLTADAGIETRTIQVGLSDGLMIEVVDGLREGETILERTYKPIE
jgi:HlyD family secretion protein